MDMDTQKLFQSLMNQQNYSEGIQMDRNMDNTHILWTDSLIKIKSNLYHETFDGLANIPTRMK